MTSVWHYESGLIPMFPAITGGVGVLVGIDTATAMGGAIALAIGLMFPLRFENIRRLD